MGIDEFSDLMPRKVTIEPFVSEDAWGAKVYGPPFVFQTARIQTKQTLARTQTGEERTSLVQVYIGPLPVIDPRSRLTLPAGFVPQQPPIIAVQRVDDEVGAHHQVLLT